MRAVEAWWYWLAWVVMVFAADTVLRVPGVRFLRGPMMAAAGMVRMRYGIARGGGLEASIAEFNRLVERGRDRARSATRDVVADLEALEQLPVKPVVYNADAGSLMEAGGILAHGDGTVVVLHGTEEWWRLNQAMMRHEEIEYFGTSWRVIDAVTMPTMRPEHRVKVEFSLEES